MKELGVSKTHLSQERIAKGGNRNAWSAWESLKVGTMCPSLHKYYDGSGDG